MPIYEYRCPECGSNFEKFITGQVVVVCPSCQSANVQRTMSLVRMKIGSAFRASGSGGCGCGHGGCGCH
ncbi:MAG: zinc ribbon domain-containing protein [Candidatus Methylomirabilales bacterium]